MPTRKQPPEPSLRTILKEIRSQGAMLRSQGAMIGSQGGMLASHDIALAELRAQGVRLEDRMQAQGDRLEKELGSQVARLEGLIQAQGDRLDDRIRSHVIILEEIRSQNRVIVEAVEAMRVALEKRLDRLDRETGARDRALELAIKDVQIDVKQNSLDIRGLTAKVEALRMEDRVAALERRGS